MDAPKAGALNHWDAGETLADRFRVHVGNAEHLYGYAVRGMAQDWETGGPVRMACSGYENAPRGSAIHLRLLAGVFRLVLTGRAEEPVAFYPCLGGSAPASQAWPVIREVIGAHVDEMHAALAVPPQTNEVGRSAALLAGLFDLVAASGVRRIRLLEVGASAGLNLLLDHYAYRGDSWQFGFTDSKIQFVDSIEGPVQPEHFMITSRAGCDLHPVDATTADRQAAADLVCLAVRLGSPPALELGTRDRGGASGAHRQGAGKPLVALRADRRAGWTAGCLALNHPDVLAER